MKLGPGTIVHAFEAAGIKSVDHTISLTPASYVGPSQIHTSHKEVSQEVNILCTYVHVGLAHSLSLKALEDEMDDETIKKLSDS